MIHCRLLPISLLVLASCAEPATPPPRTAAAQQQPPPDLAPVVDPILAIQTQEADATTRSLEALSKQADETRRKHAADKQAERDKIIKLCADTRASRARAAQGKVKEYLDWEKRLTARSAEIRAACKLTLTNTGDVNVTSNGGQGFRVQRVKQEGVSCRPAVPKGLTEEEAWFLLSSTQPGAVSTDGMPVVNLLEESVSSSLREMNSGECRKPDLDVGLDTEARKGDEAGLKRFLDWTPPATP